MKKNCKLFLKNKEFSPIKLFLMFLLEWDLTLKGFNDGVLHLIFFFTKSIIRYAEMKPRRFRG
jgi:hypothetical protein